jgi:hypothetical protein
MLRVSEVGSPSIAPKNKQTFTPRLNTMKREPYEFTTQESTQTQILKTHLKDADASQQFPRLELDLEESKESQPNVDEDIEVDDPSNVVSNK